MGHGARHCADETDVVVHLLAFAARVLAPAAIRDGIRQVFPDPPFWSIVPEAALVTFTVEPDDAAATRYHLARDGVSLGLVDDLDAVVPLLEWAIITAAVQHLQRDHLLIHAGAMAVGDAACLLPGSSASGKTTLAAALLAAGFTYLSDEIAAVSLETGRLLPFAKSLTVKSGSRRLLVSRFPQLRPEAARPRYGSERVWYLTPPSTAWPASAPAVRAVVYPDYVPGGRSTLTRITRSEALARLLDHVFLDGGPAEASVRRAVDLLQRADCFTLAVGDLAAAVDLVRALLGDEAAGECSAGAAPAPRLAASPQPGA